MSNGLLVQCGPFLAFSFLFSFFFSHVEIPSNYLFGRALYARFLFVTYEYTYRFFHTSTAMMGSFVPVENIQENSMILSPTQLT